MSQATLVPSVTNKSATSIVSQVDSPINEHASSRAPSPVTKSPSPPTDHGSARSLHSETVSVSLSHAQAEAPEDLEMDVMSFADGDSSASTRTSSHRFVSDLAPVDKGIGAWSYLIGAFIVETVVWSFPTSYGLFLPAYMGDSQVGSQSEASSLLPLIGTLSSGLIYCSGPLIYPLLARYPRHRRTCLWIGAVLCWFSLFVSSYVTTVWQLLILQGAGYGIGGSLVYAPSMSYLSEWFQERRGTANGIIFAGTAAGGLILPLILPYLLDPYGPATSIRILSIAVLVALTPALLLVRGRLPDPRAVVTGRRAPRALLKHRIIWVLMAANTVQALAYFVPLIWLPSYASTINLTDTEGSLAIMVINGVSVLSRVSLGILADHYSPWFLALASLVSVSLFTFVVWGVFSTSLSALLVFCAAYGAMAGGWTSLWTSFMKPVTHEDPTSSTTVLGFLLFSRGIGNVLSAPISTALLRPDSNAWGRTGFTVGNSRFEALIIYVGALFGIAALMVGLGWIVEVRLAPTEEDERRTR